MWALLLLSAFAALAASEEAGAIGGRLGMFAEPRLFASGVRLARMERELGHARELMKKAHKVDPRRFINEMNARLHDAEKKVCRNEHEIQCGDDSRQCISSLFLCDGHNDCHNGWDEWTCTCSPGPMVAGNVFSGRAHWKGCDIRQPHPVHVAIVSVRSMADFGARLVVDAKITFDYEEDHQHFEYMARGVYRFGDKHIELIPTDHHDDLSLDCFWNHGDDSRGECHLVHEGTHNKCAYVFLSLEHH